MFKPNVLGNHQLIHVDQAIDAHGVIASQTSTVFQVLVSDATIREKTASRMFHGARAAMPANHQLCVGGALAGDNPVGSSDAGDVAVCFNVSGFIRLRTSAADGAFSMSFGVGRCDNATLTSPTLNPCTNVMFVPGVRANYSDFGGQATISETILVADFDGAFSYDDNPLLFFWCIHLQAIAAKDLDFMGSVNCYKYIQDITSFEANRI